MDTKRRNTAVSSTEQNLPIITTQQAATLLGISPDHLRLEAKQQGGCCQRGKWLVLRAGKRNSWYPYKAQMPRPQKLDTKVA